VSSQVKYRMYVDETGNSDMGASIEKNQYLSLTGVVFELGYVASHVFPGVEELKRRYFDSHPDDPVILHRKELIHRDPPFDSLKKQSVADAFDSDLLGLLSSLEYTVFTVVIDKYEHKERYATWRYDPYHYCLAILIERYAKWLDRHAAVGDIMAESRGGKEDMRLKASFRLILEDGTNAVPIEHIRPYLTSKELKVKPKANNIAGLQIADLVAYPSYQYTRSRYLGERLPNNFGHRIVDLLSASKYDRGWNGRLEGYGIKWLP